MTLEECKSLITMLSSKDNDIVLLALNMLNNDPWFQRGSITTAVYEARRELKFQTDLKIAKQSSDVTSFVDLLWIQFKHPSLSNCIAALEQVKKELS